MTHYAALRTTNEVFPGSHRPSLSSHAGPYISCTRNTYSYLVSSCLSLHASGLKCGHPSEVSLYSAIMPSWSLFLARPLAMSKDVSTRCLLPECRSDSMSVNINGRLAAMHSELRLIGKLILGLVVRASDVGLSTGRVVLPEMLLCFIALLI